uniref:BPTI/Kunitz inhibitor domain-containing protein n=1 Tax=Panagrolaimus sp. JU765 TaxID=591449 RepID=A0AC34RAH5_9BILA
MKFLIVNFLLVFICSTFSQDCSSSRDAGESCGDGTGSSRMFYFDSRMSVCQPFIFKGCGGNSNRFATAQECKDACFANRKTGAEIRNGNQWVLAEKCGGQYLIPDGKYTDCKNGCPDQHSCQNGVCCPSKDYVCSLRDDSGIFASGIDDKPRFAWSNEIQSCWRFSYYDAKGNYNNFPTFQSCIAFCSNKQ